MKILALLALFAAPSFAETLPLPISDRVLTFEISVIEGGARLPQAGTIRVAAREGTLFRIEDSARDLRVGLVPRLTRSAAVIAPFWVGEDRAGWLKLVPAGASLRSSGKNALFAIGESVAIRIRYAGSKAGAFPDAPPFRGSVNYADREQVDTLRLIYGDPKSALCCIGVGTLRVCGCAVDIPDAGSCG